jgi:hypothetical protein
MKQQKQHTLRISDELWDRAQAIGERQLVPVTASEVLTRTLEIYLEQIEQQTQTQLGSAKSQRHKATP